METHSKREFELERLVFFSDAVVAITITLLAFGLKINAPANQHITFADLFQPWKTYIAFFLSFINIAGFWQTHHTIFMYIKKCDRRMLFLNMTWLFFIIILPFSNSIISVHFPDKPGILLYCTNIFLLSVMQKLIWDYGDDDLAANANTEMAEHIDLFFSLDLLNGGVAIVVCFFNPLVAFILLFFKIPIFIAGTFYMATQRKKQKKVL